MADPADIDASMGDVDAVTPDGQVPIDASADTAVPLNPVAVWSARDGMPDTACAPWTISKYPTMGVPVLADGTLTISTSADGEDVAYAQGAEVLQDSRPFVMEARVKFVAGATSHAARSGATLAFFLGGAANALMIHDGEVALLAGPQVKGPTHAVPTTDAFHDYRIEANLDSKAIAVWRDQQLVLFGQLYADNSSRQIIFGDTTGAAHATSEWQRVSHNAHVPVACP